MTPTSRDPNAPLAGQVAMVTGAGRGIGRAIALELGSKGADLALVDIEAPQETAQEVASAFKVKALAIAMDVTQADAVASGCAQARDTLGSVSILVNNAGLQTRQSADLHTLPAADLERMLAVHVVGSAQVAAAVIPDMRARGFGRIVNLSAVIALVGLQRRTPYSTAKAAIAGLTRGLALENGRHGITVNAVAPGYVLTDVLKEKMRLGTLDYTLYAQRSAVGRWAQPWEIARVVSFLADPASGFITAAVWPVDGGYAANGNPGEPLGPVTPMDDLL
jgi:NAD(P)-dependent dehydrogenase (short-subunit alcohol dehydrogenase family)